jgi:N-acyl-D-aspartate/D-glutamate deacylase
MAHYNFPLRLLRMAKEAASPSWMTIGRAVQRLTSEIADWLGIDAGTLREGSQADVVVVDPAGLGPELDEVQEAELEHFAGLRRLVRRNDRAVRAVLVNGNVAFEAGARSPELGRSRGFGRLLRAQS